MSNYPSGNFLVLDFEATCSENENRTVPTDEMEIIEIGAIILNPSLNIVSEFAHFVKPVRHPVLTDFCRTLTTIQQQDVNEAENFQKISADLAFWAAEHDVTWWGSWGKYDRKQLTQDASYHRLPDPLDYPHFNLKEDFSKAQGIKRRLGLAGALKFADLKFEGTAHRAIDDARNICRLLPWIFGHNTVSKSKSFSATDVEEGKVK